MIVRLSRPTYTTIVGTSGTVTTEDAVWKFIKANNKAFTCWGRFVTTQDSVSGTGHYQIGTAPSERQFWALSQDRLVLDFVEYDTWTDGEIRFQNPISLYNSWLTPKGIIPINRMGGVVGRMGRGLGPEEANEGDGKAYPPGFYFVPGNVSWSSHQMYD